MMMMMLMLMIMMMMLMMLMMMMKMMMMMRRPSSLRVRAKPRHLPNIYIYTLWLFNIAMENGPFIDGLPIKNGDFPWLCAYLSSTELTELSIQVTQNDSQATTIGSQLLERGPSMCVNVCQCMSINVRQCISMYVNQCTSMYVNVC